MTNEQYDVILSMFEENDGDEFSQNLLYAALEALGEHERFSKYKPWQEGDDVVVKPYSVDYMVRGYKAVKVLAVDEEQASKLALSKIANDISFGELEDITFEEIECSPCKEA